jgi:hypothetical protein
MEQIKSDGGQIDKEWREGERRKEELFWDFAAERQEKSLSLSQNLFKRVQGKRSWG